MPCHTPRNLKYLKIHVKERKMWDCGVETTKRWNGYMGYYGCPIFNVCSA
jgi:hypothetical protein